MANTLKLALNPNGGGPALRTLYTCPPGATAIVKSVIASNGTGAASNPSLAVVRSGVPNYLVSGTSLANTASVNLLAGTLALQAGDVLATRGGAAVCAPLPGTNIGTINQLVVSGSTIIAGTTTGIWRSTDAMATWTQVYSGGAISSTNPMAKIGSNWFVYTTATTAIRSTNDGLTWTAGVAVTNAPDWDINGAGDIVYNGAVWGGLNSNRLTTTSDGITWTLQTAFPVADVSCLTWSGTRWIAGRNSTAADIYWSTNGVAWTTVASGLPGTSVSNLVSNGSGTVIALNTSGGQPARVSTDHGSTWANSALTGLLGGGKSFWTGSVFVIPAGTAAFNVSATGANLTFEARTSQNLVSSMQYAVVGGNLVYASGSTIYLGSGTTAEAICGLNVSASLMEVV